MKLHHANSGLQPYFDDYVLHGHPYPALIASAGGILLAVNDALAQFTGCQDLLGRSIQDLGIEVSLLETLDENWKTLRIVLHSESQDCVYRTKARRSKANIVLICTSLLDEKRNALLEMTSLNNELVNLTRELRARNDALEKARSEIRTLRELLPMCAGCNSIRDDDGTWHPVAEYLIEHTDTKVTHGLCPSCIKHYYEDTDEDC